jgi:AcrR family transcriptional regulator
MPRQRMHTDEQILSAVRDLLLAHGPRGVTTAAVSERSGAPTGSLYHRFGSRAAMVAEMWVRTIREFHSELFKVSAAAEPGMDRALALAGAIVDYSSRNPQSARLMLVASREELENDPTISSDLRTSLATLNDPVNELVVQLAEELYGRASLNGVDRVTIGVIGIAYTAVRRMLLSDRDPIEIKPLVLTAARATLSAD